jgi:AAA family ATP:ADP antiporter
MVGWLGRGRRQLARAAGVAEADLAPALLAALLFFCLLCGYYIIRPVREEMGLAGGVRNLPYLYLATLSAMLLVAPFFGVLVRRFRREVFVPALFHFFAANLLLFFVLMQTLPASAAVALGRVFYVWVSVFNLFTVSLFWSYLVDGLGLEGSKRLFGFIAVGGTLGAWLGSGLTGLLVGVVGRSPLLLIAAGFLEGGVLCVLALARRLPEPDRGPAAVAPALPSPGNGFQPAPPAPGSSALGGIVLTLRSPYLLAVGGYLFLYSLSSTFVYFEQANLVAAFTLERTTRVVLFARIDFWVNLVSLATQLFFTGRVIKRLGTGLTLATLPLATALGFFALGLAPVLPVLVVFQVVRRASNYALAKPARETLFAILDRNGRYKAKNFLDTFVRRGGDAVGAGCFDVLTRLGFGLGAVAYLAIPIALVWGGLALYLGREQRRQSALSAATAATPAAARPA